MPLLLAGLVGLGFGAFGGAQADDAIEVVTGEKSGINPVTLAIVAAGMGYFYIKVIKK